MTPRVWLNVKSEVYVTYRVNVVFKLSDKSSITSIVLASLTQRGTEGLCTIRTLSMTTPIDYPDGAPAGPALLGSVPSYKGTTTTRTSLAEHA